MLASMRAASCAPEPSNIEKGGAGGLADTRCTSYYACALAREHDDHKTIAQRHESNRYTIGNDEGEHMGFAEHACTPHCTLAHARV